MDTPLQVSRLLEHGSTVHGSAEVITWTAEGPRRTSYAEIGSQSARLARALRDDLGVQGDERVGTLMWNNAEHLVAYLAVPSMGAVLHTLNLRLFPEQLVYIVNHAEDRVVIVDSTLIPLLAGVLPHLSTLRHIVVVGDGDMGPLAQASAGRLQLHRWADLLRDKPDHYDWPAVDERDAAALCYTSGTTGNPKGVAYSHRSIYLHSMQVCSQEAFGLGPASKVLAVVPMFHAMAWGLPYASFLSGASILMPDRFLQAAPLAAMISSERPTLAGAVPTIWTDLLAHLDAQSHGHLLDAGGHCGWFGLPAGADARVLRAARRGGHPCLGDDGDVAAGIGIPVAGRPYRSGGLGLPVHPGTDSGLGAGTDRRPGWLGDAQRREVGWGA